MMHDSQIGKSSPHQPCENTCYSNVGIVVALNGKGDSIKDDQNKLNQWLVIEKKSKYVHCFSSYLEIIKTWITNLWLSKSYI